MKAIVMGAQNLRVLGGPYLYNELEGGLGVEYDFVATEADRGGTLVAVRVSPLYGELAIGETETYATPMKGLPAEGFLGSAVGLELAHRFTDVTLGARGLLRDLHEIGNPYNGGLSLSAAAYAKVRITRIERDKTLYVSPTLRYTDRGPEEAAFYQFGLPQRLLEALVYFEID